MNIETSIASEVESAFRQAKAHEAVLTTMDDDLVIAAYADFAKGGDPIELMQDDLLCFERNIAESANRVIAMRSVMR